MCDRSWVRFTLSPLMYKKKKKKSYNILYSTWYDLPMIKLKKKKKVEKETEFENCGKYDY